MTYDKIGALLIHTVKRIGFERYNPKEADKSTSFKMPKLFVWKSALQTMAHTQNRSQNQAVNDTGAVVSIDQLESPVPGFIPILKGQPTV